MSSLLYTVDNIVSEVRSQIDELNVDSVDTERDILPALNRGQDFAFDIYARRYPEPILKYYTQALSGSAQEYDIPEDVFEDRILKIEIAIPSGGKATYREVQRISYKDVANYETVGQANFPYYYCIFGRKIRFLPAPTGTYPARIWCLRNPEKLVLPQGRVTITNIPSNYIIVDSVGSSLTTESDQLGSYVNVIDGQSGEIRGSLQIQSITENRVAFKTSPTRTTVLNRSISTLANVPVGADDYLAPIDGTCVPYYGRPTSNFLIQFAASELVRKLGGQADTEEKILDKFEKQVEKTPFGREPTMRVTKRSKNYGAPFRRWYYS